MTPGLQNALADVKDLQEVYHELEASSAQRSAAAQSEAEQRLQELLRQHDGEKAALLVSHSESDSQV